MVELSDRRILAISFAVIAVVLVGDAAISFLGHSDYSADAVLNGDTVDVTVSVEGTELYSIMVSENGDYTSVETLYIYLDRSRPSDVSYRMQRSYAGDLVDLLTTRGLTDVVYVDAEQLGEVLREDSGSGECAGKGLVVVSGALPDTVYTGKASDAIFRWMSAGGSLYWAGGLIGEKYATEHRLVEVDGYEEMFFGTQCLNHGDVSDAEVADEFADMLSLVCDDLSYAVDVDGIPKGRTALGIGYSADGYSSVSLVQYGKGMVCVLSGECSRGQSSDMAQVIASGMGPSSVVVGYEAMSVTGYEVRAVDVGCCGEGNITAYVSIGEDEVLYASLFRF